MIVIRRPNFYKDDERVLFRDLKYIDVDLLISQARVEINFFNNSFFLNVWYIIPTL